MREFWTPHEERELTRNYQKGASLRQLNEMFPDRTYNAIWCKIRGLGLLRKHEALTYNKKVGHLDIEASQLNASFGFIISWCIKVDGKKEIIGDKLTAQDFKVKDKLHTDKRVVESMVKALGEFDVITTFFGDYFDIPFIRSRCLKHGLDFLEYGSIMHVDVWKIVKKNMKLHSHRLEAVAEHLGVNTKTKLKPATWSRGTMGDLEAIDEIYYHNKQDVITLERVYHRLKTYSAGTRRSI